MIAAVLLTGCWQDPGPDTAEDNRPGEIKITGHDPSTGTENRDERDVSAPVEEPNSDTVIEADRIDLSIDDAPLADVVQMFTRISHANIIASPASLTGRVTANLNNVEWQPALETILNMHNYSLTESAPGSQVYRIDAMIPGAPEPMTVEVIHVNSAKEAVEIAGALEDALGIDPTLRIAAIPSRNAIVVNGTHSQQQRIKEIMERISPQRD